MTSYVLNREDAQKQVQIQNSTTNKVDYIFVQPMAKTKVPEGFEVPESFLRLNPKIKIITA